MHKLNRQNYYYVSVLLLFFACGLASSCVSLKKARYFNDLPDSMPAPPYIMDHLTPFEDPKIESNDILAITVQTISQSITNTPISSNTTGTFSELNGFLVDKNGYVELSVIGAVKVGGLTTTEARELIKQKASVYYKEPVVNVRIANFDILLMGDVTRAGSINLPNEKVSIIDAIALSGDLPLTANRKNVLLIRTEGDQKQFIRFDLTSKAIFQSPYFYLKQRDIIYVEPSRNKIQGSDNTLLRNLGIITSIISLASIALVFRSLK